MLLLCAKHIGAEGLTRRARQGRGLKGFYNYYAVPTNFPLSAFYYHLLSRWLRCLRRRSQRHKLKWRKMMRSAERWLPAQN
jgi:hypothetical protein